MSDLINCPKCSKETNKFFPYCEHCSTLLPREIPKSTEVLGVKEEPAGDAGKTIEERGAAFFAELEKNSNRTIKCPFCAEDILAEAIKCRFCGEFIGKPAANEKRYKILLVSFLCGVGLLLVLTLAYFGLSGLPKGSGGIRYNSGLSAELKSDPIKANYVKKYITLSDIGTLEETDLRGEVTKYLSGTIKNTGDKTVIKLTLTVYYFNKNGGCIGEGTISPILGTKAKPASLKPSSSNEFKLPILNVNPDWSGKIKEKIADIELL